VAAMPNAWPTWRARTSSEFPARLHRCGPLRRPLLPPAQGAGGGQQDAKKSEQGGKTKKFHGGDKEYLRANSTLSDAICRKFWRRRNTMAQ